MRCARRVRIRGAASGGGEAVQVEIVEVAPRDGLQNERTPVSTADKVELVRRTAAAGIRRVEVTSFVHPGRVPQMADAEEVVAALPRGAGTSVIGLALNERGLERAIAAGVDEVNAVLVASEEFSRRNQGVGMVEGAAVVARMAARAAAAGLRFSATIGAAFGCPFEGEVAVADVVRLAEGAAAAGVDEIALADTIGVAVPTDVRERVRAVRSAVGEVPLRCHFHNTRNTGLANAFTAVEEGVAALDASLGGIGGCPFAPAATGNIPTEDLVYLLDRAGVRTGVSLDALVEAVPWLDRVLGARTPGLLARAGGFPAPVIVGA
jgi:hydroxymethylglutaryl-CoA lyase